MLKWRMNEKEREMKTEIIACRTLEDELTTALKNTGLDFPIHWIDSGLHNTPKRLTSRLQENLKAINTERVLFVMGFCGNAVLGLSSPDCEMVIPRVDDCISLLIGSVSQRLEIGQSDAAYFLTEGWLRGERNLWVEYQYALKKYGLKQAEEISRMMYGNYSTLEVLDNGVVPIQPLVAKTKIIADTLHLKQKILPASIDYIEELLLGPWPEDRFLVKAPGECVTVEDLKLK